jgi:hypothetical protein
MIKRIVFLVLSLHGINLVAQQDSLNPTVTLSGFMDVYYAYDFDKPSSNRRPDFTYNHTRHNEVNINLAFIKASVNNKYMRANLALMTGTYANANMAAEPGVLKNIFEANIGFKLLKNKNIWLDAGVLPSHIGFESAISKDNITLTRSLAAENTPYYESGAKLSYVTKNEKLTIAAYLINGWQHIEKQAYNSKPAYGLQLLYNDNKHITINYSNFYGNEKPDSVAQYRFYNDFYFIYKSDRFSFIQGMGYGLEQDAPKSTTYNHWLSPVTKMEYNITKKLGLGLRFEYYQDRKGVIISTNHINGFNLYGYSLNLDYFAYKNIWLRVEGKYYSSKDAILKSNNVFYNSNFCLTSSLAISF